MLHKHELSSARKTYIGLLRSGAAMYGYTWARSTWTPYCDDPVRVYRFDRATQNHYRSIEVELFAPCRKCAKCLQFRQMKWRERIKRECAQAPRTWFVTLTFDEVAMAGIYMMAHELDPDKPYEARVERSAYFVVQRFLKRLRTGGTRFYEDNHRKRVQYVDAPKCNLRYWAVFERGDETDRPHFHLLIHEVDKPITYRVIASAWHYISDASLVRSSSGIGSYVSKYLTKSLTARARASLDYGQRDVNVFSGEFEGVSPSFVQGRALNEQEKKRRFSGEYKVDTDPSGSEPDLAW